MLIAVTNLSTMVKDTEVQAMVAAIDVQLRLHFLPAWRINSVSIEFFTKGAAIPGWAWVLYVIDSDTSIPGALGYHTEAGGKIDGYVMAQPVLSNGGVTLVFDPKNPGRYTVSATLSHEVMETVVDRFVNLYADNGGTSWAVEVGDPVENGSYGIAVNGTLVAVSDFVFPNFWNQEATAANAPVLLFERGFSALHFGQGRICRGENRRAGQRNSNLRRNYARMAPSNEAS